MTLREIKETKKELFAREEDLRKSAFLMSQVLAFSNSDQGRIDTEEGFKIKQQWYAKQLDNIVAHFNFSDNETKEIYKYVQQYKKLDELFARQESLNESNTEYNKIKEEVERTATSMKTMLKEDIKRG